LIGASRLPKTIVGESGGRSPNGRDVTIFFVAADIETAQTAISRKNRIKNAKKNTDALDIIYRGA
jgi:hypothetical protein